MIKIFVNFELRSLLVGSFHSLTMSLAPTCLGATTGWNICVNSLNMMVITILELHFIFWQSQSVTAWPNKDKKNKKYAKNKMHKGRSYKRYLAKCVSMYLFIYFYLYFLRVGLSGLFTSSVRLWGPHVVREGIP